jgi:signal transduction histidine kinase
MANWTFFAYGYGLGILNLIIFAWLFMRSPQHRWPVAVMLVGEVGGRVLYGLGAAQILQPNQPLAIPPIAFEYLMYAIALFRFRLFDPIPLARQAAIEQMREGMLVLNPEGEVTDLNPAAERILGIPAKQARGQPLTHLLPAVPRPAGEAGDGGPVQTEICLGNGPATRYYLWESSSLKDWRGLLTGHLFLLHDVTGQKRAQAQTLAQQRALAMLHERERLSRELHDSLGQVFSFISTQGQTVHRLLERGEIAVAEAYVDRLVEVTREADVDIRESILGLRATLSEQGLFPALAQYLARYEKHYAIRAEIERPEALADGAFEPLVEVELLRILQEALTNVRKHAGVGCVKITFAVEDGRARVTIRDDGQGFDPQAPSAKSGERVGLRVMRERAEEVGGSLRVHSEPGEGTEVVVEVPVGSKQ